MLYQQPLGGGLHHLFSPGNLSTLRQPESYGGFRMDLSSNCVAILIACMETIKATWSELCPEWITSTSDCEERCCASYLSRRRVHMLHHSSDEPRSCDRWLAVISNSNNIQIWLYPGKRWMELHHCQKLPDLRWQHFQSIILVPKSGGFNSTRCSYTRSVWNRIQGVSVDAHEILIKRSQTQTAVLKPNPPNLCFCWY